MTGSEAFDRLRLPVVVLEQARQWFEDRGACGYEGTAMIARAGKVVRLVVPDQRATRAAWGVSVEVTRRGQLQLAATLGADELYVARIHSHPGEAFHSAADDANPALSHVGALSVVVPYFGLGLRQGLGACAVLRYDGAIWRSLPTGPMRDRWVVEEPRQ